MQNLRELEKAVRVNTKHTSWKPDRGGAVDIVHVEVAKPNMMIEEPLH